MIYKTQGIVFRATDYSDSSLIVKIYTEVYGIQSFIVKGAKRKGASVKSNLFQPLTLLELTAYKNEKKQLQTLKEIRVATPLISIYSSPVKMSLLFFINEVVYKCIHEEEGNPNLFLFLQESIQLLENTEENYINFHLIFLMRLSRFLGFYPKGNFSDANCLFDMQEGLFLNTPPSHTRYLTIERSLLLNKLLLSNYYDMGNLVVSAIERRKLLEVLVEYYEIHLSHIGKLNSHKILQQIFE